jgi:hypothetical protein
MMNQQEFDFAVLLTIVQNIATRTNLPADELEAIRKFWQSKYGDLGFTEMQKMDLTNVKKSNSVIRRGKTAQGE